jgi:hypothetical protein
VPDIRPRQLLSKFPPIQHTTIAPPLVLHTELIPQQSKSQKTPTGFHIYRGHDLAKGAITNQNRHHAIGSSYNFSAVTFHLFSFHPPVSVSPKSDISSFRGLPANVLAVFATVRTDGHKLLAQHYIFILLSITPIIIIVNSQSS